MALTDVKSEQIQSSVALAGSPTTTTQSASDNSTKIATTAYVETAVANLVASAPSALNTLDELAAALNDDANFASTITTSIAAKLPLAGGTMSGTLNMGNQLISNVGATITFSTSVDGTINFPSTARINFDSDNNSAGEDFIIGSNRTAGSGGNEHFRITAAGNVGIGTTSPQSYYSKNLVVLTDGDGTGGLTLVSPATDDVAYYIFADGTSGAARYAGYLGYSHNDDKMFMGTAGTTRMTISSTGLTAVGGNHTPVAPLDVHGTNNTTFASSAAGNPANVFLTGTNAYDSGYAGSGILFGGMYNSSTHTTFGIVSGIKENTTDGQYGGALTFMTRTHGEGAGNRERMRIDSSGNVGIGIVPTFTPGGSRRLLQITNAASGGIISMGNNSSESENPRIFSDADNLGFATATTGGGIIQFYTAGSEKLRIKSGGDLKLVSGLLGIGMDATQALDIDRTSGLSIRFYESGTFRAGLQVADSSGQMIATSADNDFAIRSQSNLLFASGGNTERMRLDSSGYLHLASTGRIYFPDGGLALFGGGSDLKISHGGSGYAHHSIIEHTNTNGALKLKTPEIRLENASGENRYKIASNDRHLFYGMNSNSSVGSYSFGHTAEGNTGGYMSSWTTVFGHRIHLRNNNGNTANSHGTTSFSGSGPNNFRIMQNMGYNGVYWNASTDAGTGTNTEMANGNWYFSNTNSVSSGAQYTVTNRMHLNASGNLYITGTLSENQTISDARLKQDVEDFPSALEKMKALRTVKFNWIDEDRRGEYKEIGLIAQEVKEIYPELVGTTDSIGVTEDPETLEKVPGEERYMMHYQKLSVVLLKAMQEQQELIETLQTKVAALEAK